MDFGLNQRMEQLRGDVARNVKSPRAAGGGIYCGVTARCNTCVLNACCATLSLVHGP